jgi:hypothetical protein
MKFKIIINKLDDIIFKLETIIDKLQTLSNVKLYEVKNEQ